MRISNTALDPRRLEHFLTVARLGSLNRAASALNISQAGMTRSIRSLEEALGVVLFERNSKGVLLTKYGTILLRHGTLMQNMHRSAISQIESAKDGKASTIRIGLSRDWFFQEIMPDILHDILGDARRPNIELISGSTSQQLVEKLAKGEIDLVLGTQNAFEDHEAFEFIAGLSDMQGVLVAADNPLAKKPVCSLDDLDAAGWIVPEEGTFYRKVLTGIYNAQQRPFPAPRITSHSTVTILNILARTGHVGIGTSMLAQIHKPNALVMLPYPPQTERVLGIIYRRNNPLNDIELALIDAILAALKSAASVGA